MRISIRLFSALIALSLALGGCVKDDPQLDPGGAETTKSLNPTFPLEQAQAYLSNQGGIVGTPKLGTSSNAMNPLWDQAQFFDTENSTLYLIPLAGNLDEISEVFGGTPCGEACEHGHDHAVAGEEATVVLSTLFIKKNVQTGEITSYVQTNIRNAENIRYTLYSSLQGNVLSANQTLDGQVSEMDIHSLGANVSLLRYMYCPVCGVYASEDLTDHPKCHDCGQWWSDCTCSGGGGGTDPSQPDGPKCSICGAIGDPRCLTPENTCAGWRCSICGKLGNVDWEWNIRFHYRNFCWENGPCGCSCSVCGMHPTTCKCCNVCHQYPCVCDWDSTRRSSYTPPVDINDLHITVPKADIQTALNELSRD